MDQYDYFSGIVHTQPGQSSSFNAIARENPRLVRNFMGGEKVAPPSTIYNPKCSKLWKNITKNIQILTKETTPKQPQGTIPECMILTEDQ